MELKRRQAREWAIQMLTAADLNPCDDIDGFIEGYFRQLASRDAEDDGIACRIPTFLREMSESRVRGVLERRDELDSRLQPLLENWDLARLGTVERAVLRLGAWEILYSDVPPPVVINEAVDLVNWYSSPKSRALVNGVLDKLAHNSLVQ